LTFLNHEIVAIGFATKGVSHDISFAWSVVDRQIKVLDGFHPSRLTEVQVGLCEDVFETLVVGEDLTFVAQQVLAPCY
jgi:hypothetical protein